MFSKIENHDINSKNHIPMQKNHQMVPSNITWWN